MSAKAILHRRTLVNMVSYQQYICDVKSVALFHFVAICLEAFEAIQVPDEKGKGWVTFHLQSDAKVTIDGKTYKSPSNGLLKVQLPYGKYAYQIESEGFSPKKGEVKISKEPEYIEGFLTGTCEVIIQANKGTRLTISGIDKGTLQGTSKIFLSEGKYKFTGIYNGVKRTETVKIEKGQSTLTVNLKAVD